MLNNTALLMMFINEGGGQKIKQIACTDTTTWFINSKGELYGCGWNYYGQQGSGSTDTVTVFTKRADSVSNIVISNSTAWYITKDGDLYGCGDGENGNQGTGKTSIIVTRFTKKADNVKKVCCDKYTTWYITNSGELYGCGNNQSKQQGVGNSNGSYVTTFTKRAENVADVMSVNYYADIDYQVYGVTWYLTNSGELHGCGYNSKGQQGISPETSYIVEGFTKRADNVVQFMCSYLTTWYINKSGELYGCIKVVVIREMGRQIIMELQNLLNVRK